jgi:hypothetical protein
MLIADEYLYMANACLTGAIYHLNRQALIRSQRE